MIHKVKYGLMEVVPGTAEYDRPPDLIFNGANGREFAAFFAPYGTIEGERMKDAYYDYYAPFEDTLKREDTSEAA